MPLDPIPQPRSGDVGALVRELSALRRDVDRLTKGRDTSSQWYTDGTITVEDPSGNVRTRFGFHPDGKYGLRVWDAFGTLTIDSTV